MELARLDNSMAENVLAGTHASGLHVTLVPKPGYARTFAVMAAHFGSVDNRFRDPRGGALVTVPDGVAHFLEHKMFEDEQGDVSERFSTLGAACNASTGFTVTSYVFSATRSVPACLDLLLDFVQKAYFTKELVAKEQGIIGQEIRMYHDDPSWRIFFNLLESLYREHPVRINIAGSEESIARIDPEVLFACHRAFYRPANLALTIAGGFDAGALLELVEQDLAERDPVAPGRHVRLPCDDGAPPRRTARLEMDVARPKLLVGYKDRAVGGSGLDVVRRELLSSVVLDLLLGRSSTLHEELYNLGLIDESFSVDYTGDLGFGFATVGGDTDEPERLADLLNERIAAALERGVSAADFTRLRNKFLGRFAGMFDSLEGIAYAFSAGAFRDTNPFAALGVLECMRLDDVEQRARELLRAEQRACSIILPREGGAGAGAS